MLTKTETKLSLVDQMALLNKCIEQKLDLNTELRKLGLTYESLRYKSDSQIESPTEIYEKIENLRKPHNAIPAVSFFSGAGSMDIGFDYAGFNNIASIEINDLFCETLRYNFPDRLVIGPPNFSGDVKDKDNIAKILQDSLNIQSPFEGVFHGGPPCQPFSIASNQRFAKSGNNFKRKGFEDEDKGNLLEDYVWFINHFRPKVFVIENVPGLLELDNGHGLNKELQKLKDTGYNISKPQILNTAEFGIPQKRMRLIIIGSRTNKNFEFPKPNNYKTPCFGVFSENLEDTENHQTREHTAQSVLRYMQLEFGKRDQLGRVDRLNPFLPSKTVIAGGTKGGGRSHLHPYSPRTISVRESARLQTFPDNYTFTGPTARQFTQVGNAVPPLLAFKLANEIYEQFYFNNNE